MSIFDGLSVELKFYACCHPCFKKKCSSMPQMQPSHIILRSSIPNLSLLSTSKLFYGDKRGFSKLEGGGGDHPFTLTIGRL